MENKHTFQARVEPYFSPSEQLDIKLAYCLAKFGHRAQTRKELTEGKPTRYFEHVRRVAIILMDEMKIMDRDMIIAALLHDSIEDTKDLTPDLLEHSFGSHVVTMITLLSKVPKEGYEGRLINCSKWQVMAIKACDNLDNQRYLMIPGATLDFQKKQIKKSKENYYPIFDRMIQITPPEYLERVSGIRDELRRVVERNSTLVELREQKGE